MYMYTYMSNVCLVMYKCIYVCMYVHTTLFSAAPKAVANMKKCPSHHLRSRRLVAGPKDPGGQALRDPVSARAPMSP